MSRNPGWKLTMSYPEGWEQLPTTDKDKARLWVRADSTQHGRTAGGT